MKLCDPVTVTAVKRDGSGSVNLTASSSWEFDALRSRISTASVVSDRCKSLDGFLPLVDLLEFHLADELMMRYLLSGWGHEAVSGVGMVAQLDRRRFSTRTVVAGGVQNVWQNLWTSADNISPLYLERPVEGAYEPGHSIRLEFKQGDSMLLLHDSLAGVHITYGEHRGKLRAYLVDGAYPITGPPIRPHWFTPATDTSPVTTGDVYVTEILLRYGAELDKSVTWPPGGSVDPAAPQRLQSRPLEYPEVESSTIAYSEARIADESLSAPQRMLTEMSLDLAKVEWDWLVPGQKQISALPGTEGLMCGLDQVLVSGSGDSVSEASALWDQVDVESLRRRAATEI